MASSHCCIQPTHVSASAVNSISNKPSKRTCIINASIPSSTLKPVNASPFLGSDSMKSLQSCKTKHSHYQRLTTQKSLKAVAMAGGGDANLPVLNELPLLSYINQQGYIIPPVEPGSAATVFAVFDMNKKIQYVGFSKDVRNSLRTLMGRRPELCYYYKVYNLKDLDQQLMISIRQQWFSEVGLPPSGNTDPIQRSYWEKPTDAGSISERGKVAAAKSKAKTLLQMMVDRGLKEEMVYDPSLLEKGQCDVLPSTSEASDAASEAALAESESTGKKRTVQIESPSGEVIEFDIVLESKYVTNGGWMYDVLITKDDKETRHRVVCGRIYTQPSGLPEDRFIERIFAFLLYMKTPRRTEGVLAINQFAANYFSVSEVAQKFDKFNEWFGSDMPDSYWRFNRIHSYGNKTAPVGSALPSEMTFPKY